MSDWMLAQGTVDFRNEERRAHWRALPDDVDFDPLEPTDDEPVENEEAENKRRQRHNGGGTHI